MIQIQVVKLCYLQALLMQNLNHGTVHRCGYCIISLCLLLYTFVVIVFVIVVVTNPDWSVINVLVVFRVWVRLCYFFKIGTCQLLLY